MPTVAPPSSIPAPAKLSVLKILCAANHYITSNKLFCFSLLVANLAYMLLYCLISGGISNPLSILWLIGYYIFWCAFYRYYYQLRPYFFYKAIAGSLQPSTKALLIMFAVMLLIVLMPMVPLLLGYNGIYLDFYERYMQVFEGMAAGNGKAADLADVLLIYSIMALLSPVLICKPYMAWISSLRRQNASLGQAGRMLSGNYWVLVILSALLMYPEAVATRLDKLWKLQGWLQSCIVAVLFVYTNIVFAKIYDWLYLKN